MNVKLLTTLTMLACASVSVAKAEDPHSMCLAAAMRAAEILRVDDPNVAVTAAVQPDVYQTLITKLAITWESNILPEGCATMMAMPDDSMRAYVRAALSIGRKN